jgi:hypothetical protein
MKEMKEKRDEFMKKRKQRAEKLKDNFQKRKKEIIMEHRS